MDTPLSIRSHPAIGSLAPPLAPVPIFSILSLAELIRVEASKRAFATQPLYCAISGSGQPSAPIVDEPVDLLAFRAMVAQPIQRLLDLIVKDGHLQIGCVDNLRIDLRHLLKMRLIGHDGQKEIPVIGSFTFKLTDLDHSLDGEPIGLIEISKIQDFPDIGHATRLHLKAEYVDVQIVVVDAAKAMGIGEVIIFMEVPSDGHGSCG